MDLSQLNQFIQSTLQTWIEHILPKLRAKLEKQGIKDTGELENSLRASLASDAGKLSTKIILEYVVQGKFQDLKRWSFTKQPPVNELSEWVERNLSKFPFVPGYKNSNKIPSPDKAARRIAWGIARKWDMKGKVSRKNQWRPLRTIYDDLPEIREEIQEKIAVFGFQSIKDAILQLS